MKPIIIIGSGLAGYNLAKEFRKHDKTTPLIIITQDAGDFYSKPLLSTAFTQQKSAASLILNQAEEMAQQLSATVLNFTKVLAIDSQQQLVQIDKQTLEYSKLIFACGAEVRKLPSYLEEHALHVNNLEDYAHFQVQMSSRSHVTIIGSGLIGCEFANDLRNVKKQVEVISLDAYPLATLLPETIAKLLAQALEERGVIWHFNTSLAAIEKHNNGYQLTLTNNVQIKTEIILTAIGISPAITLAKMANVATSRGIVVNRYLQTNHPNIFALGDCAEIEGFVLPYVTPLMQCARSLAKTLAGELTELTMPNIPIVVKTSCFPLAICPPRANTEGEWMFVRESTGVKALFYDVENNLQGFILTENKITERIALAQQLPILF